MKSDTGLRQTPGGWSAWGQPALAVAIVLVLGALGVANMLARARSSEVEDGVFWTTRPGGVTATAVAAGSAASRSGIEPGDVLVAINGVQVGTREEVIAYQHRSLEGTQLAYVISRIGARRTVGIVLAPASPDRKSTRLNSSHIQKSRMPSSA